MPDYTWYATSDGSLLSVVTGSDVVDVPTAKERLAALCGEYMADNSSADIADVTDDPLLDAAADNLTAYRYNTGNQEIELKP